MSQVLVARAYGWAYDAVVDGFEPYERLVDDIARLLDRAADRDEPSRVVSVLDVGCGTGTVARRLARRGYSVVGLDPVGHLAAVARRLSAGTPNVRFFHGDVARERVPGEGTFDAVVSVSGLYWHPAPRALLRACRRMLRPGGHAVVVTYARPPLVLETMGRMWAAAGPASAMRALRWLVPTAAFEMARRCERRYLTERDLTRALADAGFEVLQCRPAFLAGVSHLAWARAVQPRAEPEEQDVEAAALGGAPAGLGG
ncbi:MAG: class I SAM-dependent methyltransferase [Candidatus Rokubacteria bacterium]|nr:class I SAM-dependent methyltransferase [Candidatus Rokubacteria bacterium]MBI3826920.1 class I SAM-dependent methyltransferase [Candidatus Rokubacteria bacterium]